jgi:prepilin-type processing-associated H-X9-DG protein
VELFSVWEGATWAVIILPYLERQDLYNLWDFNKVYYEQSPEMLTSQIALYYCPTRRSAADNLLSESVSIDYGGQLWGTFIGSALGDYAVCGGQADGTLPTDAHGTVMNWGGAILVAKMTDPSLGSAPFLAYHKTSTQWRSQTNLTMITDGTSNTFLAGEKHVMFGKFGRSGNLAGDLNSDWKYWYADESLYYPDYFESDINQRTCGGLRPLATTPDMGYFGSFGSWHPNTCPFVFCDGSVRQIENGIDVLNYKRLALASDGQVITWKLD